MGGHRAGEVASSRAIEIIPRHLADAAEDPSLPLIGLARPEFSTRDQSPGQRHTTGQSPVHQEAARHAEYQGMGTTVVAAWLVGPVLSIAHVGDSRLYLHRGNAAPPLDQPIIRWRRRTCSPGFWPPMMPSTCPHRHVLTRAVGVHATVEVELAELPVLDDDVLLLCSDGLTAGVLDGHHPPCHS